MYASSDVCIVPLKRGVSEASIPSKVYSGLAAARPLIASVDKGSDTWSLVDSARCGLCVPPEDPKALAEAIVKLYNDRELRVQKVLNGRAYVEENFSRKKVTKMYEELFMSVAGKRA